MNEEDKKRLLRGADLSKLDRSPVQRVDDFQKSVAKDIPREKIDTKSVWQKSSMSDVADKIAAFRAARAAGKKVMGVIPFAGTAYGLMSGDPAMAAEEAAGDVPFLGQAYEAIKPTDSGNVEEERQMIAERDARADYDKSPAHLDRMARMNALRAIGR